MRISFMPVLTAFLDAYQAIVKRDRVPYLQLSRALIVLAPY